MRRPRDLIESLGWTGFFILMMALIFLIWPGFALLADTMLRSFFDLGWFDDYIKKLKYPIWVYGLFGLGALGFVILLRIEQVLWEVQSFNNEYSAAKWYFKYARGLPAYDEEYDDTCGCGDRLKPEEADLFCNPHYIDFLRWINGATDTRDMAQEVQYAVEEAGDVLAEKIARQLRS